MEARQRALTAAQRAGVLSAWGDTARLAQLADSVEVLGAQSASGRDRRLHHHVRGLLWRARGAPQPAADEFRRAIYSPTSGFTRVNLELAGALLDLDRPREAIDVLSPAFRGPIEGSNLYVTRSELHDEMGRAWEAAGNADSASYHYRRASEAWRRADPSLRSRADFVLERLSALRSGAGG
jgi:hypothetical protein